MTNNGRLIIRAARTHDVEQIVGVIRLCAQNGSVLARSEQEILDALPGFAVAESGGVVVGCAALCIVDRELGEIRSVAVHPEGRSLGAGRQLITYLLDVASQLGIVRIFLITRLPEFFARIGFVEVDPTTLADRFLDDLMHQQGRTYREKSVMIRDAEWRGGYAGRAPAAYEEATDFPLDRTPQPLVQSAATSQEQFEPSRSTIYVMSSTSTVPLPSASP